MKNVPEAQPFSVLMAEWLRTQIRALVVSDQIEKRPIERGIVYLDIVTREPIAHVILLCLHYVLYVKCDGVDLKLACEPVAVEFDAEAPRPTSRVMLKIVGAPSEPDLAAAWTTILDQADASSLIPKYRRSWGADVKRVMFYNPREPESRCVCLNSAYEPMRHVRASGLIQRLPKDGRTDEIDVDAAFDACATESDEKVVEAMKAAKAEERAHATS